VQTATTRAMDRRNMTTLSFFQPSLSGLETLRVDSKWGSTPTAGRWDFDVASTCGGDACSAFQKKAINGTFAKNLDNAQCLKIYLEAFNNRSDVLLVTTRDILQPEDPITSLGTSLLFAGKSTGTQGPGTYWPCGSTNTFDCRKPDLWVKNSSIIRDWNVAGYKVDYCLSSVRSTDDACSVNYSQLIMISKEIYQPLVPNFGAWS
jgi:hypothetical protein